MVIYAGSLVNPALLSYTKPGCEIHNSAKMTLEGGVIAVIRAAEAAGKTTVRLHTGDSSIYGAVREQFDELEALGIAHDVCPGVSAFCGGGRGIKSRIHLAGCQPNGYYNKSGGPHACPGRASPSAPWPPIGRRWCSSSTSLTESCRRTCSWAAMRQTPAAVVYKATGRWRRSSAAPSARSQDCDGKRPDQDVFDRRGRVCLGDTYLRSLLYHPGFTTEFREATQ